MIKKILISVLIFFTITLKGFCLERLHFNGFIADNANVISKENENSLNRMLSEFHNKTKSNLIIVTLNSLQGKSIENVSFEITEKYNYRYKKLDNSALILFVPNEKNAKIQLGRELKYFITDKKTKRILNNYMRPYFEKGEYEKGVKDTSLVLASEIAKTYDIKLSFNKPKRPKKDGENPWILPFSALAAIMLRRVSHGFRPADSHYIKEFMGRCRSFCDLISRK